MWQMRNILYDLLDLRPHPAEWAADIGCISNLHSTTKSSKGDVPSDSSLATAKLQTYVRIPTAPSGHSIHSFSSVLLAS